MNKIIGQTIQDKCLELDDKHFVDCILINCTLEYSGRPSAFERTTMRGCSYVFFGRARQTVHFLQGVGLMPNESSDWAEISGLVH